MEEEFSLYELFTRKTETATIYYIGEEVFMSSKSQLLGAGTLKAGVHRNDFKFTLPSQLIASREMKYGSIQYEIEAKLDIPSAFHKKVSRIFTIAPNVNFIMLPSMNNEFRAEITKSFCFGGYGPYRVSLTLPRSDFVPGEMLNYKINCQSKSSFDLSQTHVVLRRIVIYKSDNPCRKIKIERDEIVRDTFAGLTGQKECCLEGQMEIPNVVPTDMHYCRLMRLLYDFKVRIVPEKLYPGDIVIHAPIFIGSAPPTDENGTQQNPLNFIHFQQHDSDHVQMLSDPYSSQESFIIHSEPRNSNVIQIFGFIMCLTIFIILFCILFFYLTDVMSKSNAHRRKQNVTVAPVT